MKKFTFTLLFSLSCYSIMLGQQGMAFDATGLLTSIRFSTFSTERMRINFNGYVGIGTAAPKTKFHILDGTSIGLPALPLASTVLSIEKNADANLSIFTPATDKGSIIFGNPADLEKGWIRYNHSNNEMQLGTNSTPRFYIKSGGKVGIGTSNPDFNLEVNATSDAGFAVTRYGGDSPGLFGNSAGGTEAVPTATQLNHTLSIFGGRGHDGTGFTSSRARIETRATQNWTSTANGTKMTFFTTPNGTVSSTQQMIIDQDGKVGIGATTPQAKLDVDGDIILGTVDRSWAGVGTTFVSLDRQGKSVIRFTGNGIVNLSGIAGGVDGMIIYLYNFQSASFTIFNDDPVAPSQNRILTGNANANIVFGAKGGAILVYDGVTQRWRVLSYNI